MLELSAPFRNDIESQSTTSINPLIVIGWSSQAYQETNIIQDGILDGAILIGTTREQFDSPSDSPNPYLWEDYDLKVHNVKESVDVVVKATTELVCPPATQDLKLNTKNRDAAIHEDHIQYGPLNVDEPGDYWKDIAEYWNTDEKAAKASLCGNCVAFDISPRMKDCMPGETSDKDGELGYCWMHHFKCHSARSCRTWAKGGPIKMIAVLVSQSVNMTCGHLLTLLGQSSNVVKVRYGRA